MENLIAGSSPRMTQRVEIDQDMIEAVIARLAANQRVRRGLPVWGRLHIDRQLPFLCVYRRSPQRLDRWTDSLVVGEASYLKASGDRRCRKTVSRLVESVVKTLGQEFGAFLLVEVWTTPEVETPEEQAIRSTPANFRILADKIASPASAVEFLQKGLARISIAGTPSHVDLVPVSRIAPPGLPPLLPAKRIRELACSIVGLEVRPIFRDAQGETLFPMVRRTLHRGITLALRQCFYRFSTDHTTHQPPHFHSLGRRAVVRAVWDVDRRLAEIAGMIDLMMLVTPVNTDQAWNQFKRGHFRKAPSFLYRPIPVAPTDLKRRLFQAPVHRVEDPALADMLEEKRTELDRRISLLRERGSSDFLHTSLQLYGGVSEELLGTATQILRELSSKKGKSAQFRQLDARQIAEHAQAEILRYQERSPGFTANVQVRSDVPGLMVSRGRLLIGAKTKTTAFHLDAMLHHEIGTHLLCHSNGNVQPLRLLRSGMPRYEELQEGLAVLAEYLAGGLKRSRLRILAARVLACRRLVEGEGVVSVFEELHEAHGFDHRTAFFTAMRVFRGGGFTKDTVYLRGLVALMDYLRRHGNLEVLFLGKFSLKHVPVIEELLWREVLHPVPLQPRYLDDPGAIRRLDRIRSGLELPEIISEAVG